MHTIVRVVVGGLFSLWVGVAQAGEWVDISLSADIKIKSEKFDPQFKEIRTKIVSITNSTNTPITGPLRLVVKNSSVPILNSDGTDANLNPYFDIEEPSLAADDTIVKTVEFEKQKTNPVFQAVLMKNYQDADCHASQCFSDAVFFTTADEPVKASVNFDNSTKAWDWSAIEKHEDLHRETPLYSHLLYPYGSGNEQKYEAVHELFSKLIKSYKQNPINNPLADRLPIILIHGWQGNYGSNNYIGAFDTANMPETYFKEFLAFWDSETSIAESLRSKYKLYVYKYPSFEHITYNGRMLGEAIWSVPELRQHIQSGKKISFLAHSMGGLVARSFIEEHGLGQTELFSKKDADGDLEGTFVHKGITGPQATSKLITLATPHHGTPAATDAWIDNIQDLAFFALKNTDTPGANDLMWDNFDRAIDMMLIEEIEIASISDDFYDATDPVDGTEYEIFYWRERAEEPDDGLDNFDKYYGEFPGFAKWTNDPNGQCLVTSISKKDQCFEHPNPWLKNLNVNLETNLTQGVEYFFYSGSLIRDFTNNPYQNNPLDTAFDWDIGFEQFIRDSNYLLADMVVPTASALLDLNIWENGFWRTTWEFEQDYGKNNITSNLNIPDDIADPWSALYKEGNTLLGKFRYFHDYDHDKMRGGSGNNNDEDAVMPDDYEDHWFNNANYKTLLSKIGYVDANSVDVSDSQQRLEHEPLFLKIASDLGVEINGDSNPDDGLIIATPVGATAKWQGENVYQDPLLAIDGDTSTGYFSTGVHDFGRDQTMWWQMDLGEALPIKLLRVFWNPNVAPYYKEIDIDCGVDGAGYTKIVGRSRVNIDGTWTEFPVDNSCRYIKINYIGSGSGGHGMDLMEVEALYDGLSAGLVAHYPFDGSSVDAIGSNNGNDYGDAHYTAGLFNSALTLDGDGDYVQMDPLPSISAFTVSYWMKKDGSMVGSGMPFTAACGPDGDGGYFFSYEEGANQLHFYVGKASDCSSRSGTVGVSIPLALSTGSWHHVAGIYEPGVRVALYIDGIKVAENLTGVPASIMNNPQFVGTDLRSPGANYNWNGQVDELKIYDRALSPTEVAGLYGN